MNTLQLRSYLRKFNSDTGVKVIVCAIDELPYQIKRKSKYAFVINLSKSSEPGSHWVSLYVDKDGVAYYLDSYGFKPKSFQILHFLKRNCIRIHYNMMQLQQLNSKVCGMYAASFVIHMIKGHSLDSFISKFSKNLLINDLFIAKNFAYYLRN